MEEPILCKICGLSNHVEEQCWKRNHFIFPDLQIQQLQSGCPPQAPQHHESVASETVPYTSTQVLACPTQGNPISVPLTHGYKICVVNLAKNTKEKWLEPLFSPCGNVLYCKIFPNHAIVCMEHEDDAVEAISKLNGLWLYGQQIQVRKYEENEEIRELPSFNLVVKNLSHGLLRPELCAILRAYGTVSHCYLSRSTGFVRFTPTNELTIDDVLHALNGQEINGIPMKLELSSKEIRARKGIRSPCFNCGYQGHMSVKCDRLDYKTCEAYKKDAQNQRVLERRLKSQQLKAQTNETSVVPNAQTVDDLELKIQKPKKH